MLGTVHDLAAEHSKIIRPDSAPKSLAYILIVDIGPDCKWAKPGDKLLCFDQGFAIPVDGQDYVLAPESSVFGKLETIEEVKASDALKELAHEPPVSDIVPISSDADPRLSEPVGHEFPTPTGRLIGFEGPY